MRDKFGYELRFGDFIKYFSMYGIVIDDNEAYLFNSADNQYYIVNYIPRECELKKYKTIHEKELYDKILKDYRATLSKK